MKKIQVKKCLFQDVYFEEQLKIPRKAIDCDQVNINFDFFTRHDLIFKKGNNKKILVTIVILSQSLKT